MYIDFIEINTSNDNFNKYFVNDKKLKETMSPFSMKVCLLVDSHYYSDGSPYMND